MVFGARKVGRDVPIAPSSLFRCAKFGGAMGTSRPTLAYKGFGEIFISADDFLFQLRTGDQFLKFTLISCRIQRQIDGFVLERRIKNGIRKLDRMQSFTSRSDERATIKNGIDEILGNRLMLRNPRAVIRNIDIPDFGPRETRLAGLAEFEHRNLVAGKMDLIVFYHQLAAFA